MVLAGVGPWTFVQQLPQMIGCGPEVAFPPLALSVAVPIGSLQVFDHPLPHQHARYIAALTDATQAQVVGRAVEEYAARHADAIQAGIERARSVLAGGETAIAAHLLDVPVEDIERVAGNRGNRAGVA